MATLDTKEIKKVFAEVDSHDKSQIKESQNLNSTEASSLAQSDKL